MKLRTSSGNRIVEDDELGNDYDIPISGGSTGPAGVTGSPGVTGAPGVAGAQGSPGVTGLSAYESAVDNGFSGDIVAWLTSLHGQDGAQGATGPAGATGVGLVGATGLQGVAGSPGATGIQGIQGLLGVTGSPGVTGIQGIQGIQGVTGIQGVAGSVGATGSPGVTGLQGVTGSPGVTGTAGVGGGVSARVTADRTTTAATFANVTDAAIAIGASETWSFEAYLTVGCNNTGGGQWTITVPSGATGRFILQGNTTSATAWTSGTFTTFGGNTVTMCAANAQGRQCRISGVVVNSTNAGNIQIQHRAITAGQTVTTNANSYITGRKH